jgi:drug/metabolite transporter (DMT)-like permease
MTSGNAPRAPVILNFAAVYLVWGSTYLAIRYAVQTIPPFLMAGTRFLISGAILYLWTRTRGEARPVRANWRAAAIIAFFLILGGNGGVVWAELRVPSGLTALLVASVPLWVVLFEWWGGGRSPTGRVWLGIAIGFVGLGILVGPSDLLGGNSVDLWGAAALVAASVTWAIGSVASRRVALPPSPLLSTGMEMLLGGAMMMVVGVAIGEGRGFHLADVSRESWTGLAYLTIVGSLVGFTAYVWLIHNVEMAKASTYAYVNPVVAVFLGWAIAGEPLSARVLGAAAVIVAGVVVISTGRERPLMERPATAGASNAA